MGLYYITFRSVTFAQRGEKLLSRQNHRVSLMRTPRWMEEQGCGYCLKLSCAQTPRAVAVLQESQIHYRKVYLYRKEGQLEEMHL